MPWRIKRTLGLFICGFAALGLAIVVLVRNRSVDTVLLACLGLVGGLAIILNNLPDDDNKP
jgi:hypothetical protein